MSRSLGPLALLVLAGCAPLGPVERGEQAFHDPGLAGSPSSPVSCASCHVTGALPANRILPGGTLRGVMGRPTYFGGALTDPLEATNACLYYFMRGSSPEPLAADDPRGRDLLAYLETLGTDPSPAVAFTLPTTLPTTLPPGDATRGADVYARGCQTCHGEPHTAAGRPSVLTPRIPEDTVAEHGDAARSIVIGKVRHGGFYGIGGAMPPFSEEVLDDGALADVLAYLGL